MDPLAHEAARLLLCPPRIAVELLAVFGCGGEGVLQTCGGDIRLWSSYHAFLVPFPFSLPVALNSAIARTLIGFTTGCSYLPRPS